MKKMTAKFTSKCAETNLPLRKGDTIYFCTYTRKAYHPTANKVKESNEAEATRSYVQAQEEAYFDRFSTAHYNY